MFSFICLQIEIISFTILDRTFYIGNFIVSKYMIDFILFLSCRLPLLGSREATMTVYVLFEPDS